jgi:hypothetical protein
LAAVVLAGCATNDYDEARAARFDRPYRGGAADVPDDRSRSSIHADIGAGVVFLVQVLGHVFDGPGR